MAVVVAVKEAGVASRSLPWGDIGEGCFGGAGPCGTLPTSTLVKVGKIRSPKSPPKIF